MSVFAAVPPGPVDSRRKQLVQTLAQQMANTLHTQSNLRQQNRPNLQRLASKGLHTRAGLASPGAGFDYQKGALGRNQYTHGFAPAGAGLGVVNASQNPNDMTQVGTPVPLQPQFNGVDPNQTIQGPPGPNGAPTDPTLTGSLTNPLGPPSVGGTFDGGGAPAAPPGYVGPPPAAPANPGMTNQLTQWLIQNGMIQPGLTTTQQPWFK